METFTLLDQNFRKELADLGVAWYTFSQNQPERAGEAVSDVKGLHLYPETLTLQGSRFENIDGLASVSVNEQGLHTAEGDATFFVHVASGTAFRIGSYQHDVVQDTLDMTYNHPGLADLDSEESKSVFDTGILEFKFAWNRWGSWDEGDTGPAFFYAVALALSHTAHETILRELYKVSAPQVAFALAANPSVPRDLLLNLAASKDAEIQRAAASNPNFPRSAKSVRERDTRTPADPPSNVFTALIRYMQRLFGATPELVSNGAPQEVTSVQSSDLWEARAEEAANPQTSASRLRQLAEDDEATVRRAVLDNPNCPVEVLILLEGDTSKRLSYDAKITLSRHPQASADTLQRLAAEPLLDIRMNVAAHAATPPDALTRLAQDEDALVRRNVAGNANAPDEALMILSGDKDRRIRLKLASSVRTPEESLRRLTGDGDSEVREKADFSLRALRAADGVLAFQDAVNAAEGALSDEELADLLKASVRGN